MNRERADDVGVGRDAGRGSGGVEFGHHAQNDRWAIEAVFPNRRGGYFVEAGACGGWTGSASYVLEREFGWNGICVEPLDSYYKVLQRLRACDKDPRCLSGRTGDLVEFLSYAEDRARSGIQSLNKNADWAERNHAHPETTIKETVTLSDLLEQHDAPDTVDYLCLDVEGAERTILEPYDFAADRRILAISIEGGKCDDLLAANGYRRARNPFDPGEIDHYFLHASLVDGLGDLLF